MPDTLTHAELLRTLAYDAGTGVFTWRADRKYARSDCKSGCVAGGADGSGYRRIRIGNRRYKAHRLAWFYVHGEWPNSAIDHIDGERGNDRISNLRPASRAVNAQNQHKPHTNNTSGYLGVGWHKATGKFVARVSVSGVKHSAGYHETAAAASVAYLALKVKLHEGYAHA